MADPQYRFGASRSLPEQCMDELNAAMREADAGWILQTGHLVLQVPVHSNALPALAYVQRVGEAWISTMEVNPPHHAPWNISSRHFSLTDATRAMKTHIASAYDHLQALPPIPKVESVVPGQAVTIDG